MPKKKTGALMIIAPSMKGFIECTSSSLCRVAFSYIIERRKGRKRCKTESDLVEF